MYIVLVAYILNTRAVGPCCPSDAQTAAQDKEHALHSQAMDIAYRPFSNGDSTKAAFMGMEFDVEAMDQIHGVGVRL